MALITIQPTSADKDIANAIAAHTMPDLERAAQFMTWGADEKVLLALAVAAGCTRRIGPRFGPLPITC